MEGGEMKVINEGLPLNDVNLGKARGAEQGLPRQAGRRKTERVPAQYRHEVQQRIAVTQSRISKAQTILNAFQQVVIWIDGGEEQSNYKELVSDLIEKTKYRNERVLEPYQSELSRILSRGDVSGLRTLIGELEEEIRRMSTELGRNQTTQQNILAMDRTLEEEELNKLLQKVIADLKSTGKLNVNLARDRVIDLLG
jgi:polyhydroxyalkanoate synthesis regulator phasin